MKLILELNFVIVIYFHFSCVYIFVQGSVAGALLMSESPKKNSAVGEDDLLAPPKMADAEVQTDTAPVADEILVGLSVRHLSLSISKCYD